ncbi:uncharacterized protein CEXT_809231 [Caerostris extrusa]|uniref:Uncharacterized protein n=1 Tax=Caerostris extrusa TaxID=172846 RepID=A0AAV4WRN8_CAEEX|nr:uncharacterized protein CEXT_809231 [Caerostris extrusa]
MDKHHVSITSQITKEEIFLMSFPSLNPYVVHHMLSLCSLHELMNLALKELLLNQDFKLKPNFQENLNFSLDFDDPEDIPEDETFTNIETVTNNLEDDITSLWTHQKESPCTPEKSLQELDLDYMSLKWSHKYDAYENYLNEEDTPITNETSNNANQQEDSYTFEILNSKLPKSIWDTDDYHTAKNNDFIKLTKLNNRLDFLNSSSNRVAIGQEALPHSNSQKENNFKQFLCTPRKRKYSMVQDSVKNNDTIISSPILKKSCRIQKGMVSKLSNASNIFTIVFGTSVPYPPSPLRSLPMTQTTSRRLGYEKMPGVKGQTRESYVFLLYNSINSSV